MTPDSSLNRHSQALAGDFDKPYERALETCSQGAYVGPTLCFLEEEGMRRTRMPITEVIIWLQAEQKAEARKRQQLQRRKRQQLQKQPRPGDRRRAK